jgi:AICAR transformylase/IMP cyclohydrolase PurH
MKEFDIPQIDLVIVDLYPFEKQLPQELTKVTLKKIDIAGLLSRCRKTSRYCYNCFSGRI